MENSKLIEAAINSGNPEMAKLVMDRLMPPAINKAMAYAMLDIKHVAKDQFNKMQQFNFRGIDDLYNAIHAALAKNGIFTTSRVISRTDSERKTAKGGTMFVCVLRIEYTFHATDGSSVSTESEGESADSGDKSTSKALAMADKYALIQAFKVPTSDMPDADKEAFVLESKPKITADQVKGIEVRISDYGVSRPAFISWLKKLKIKSIEAIPADVYQEVIDSLEAKKPETAGA